MAAFVRSSEGRKAEAKKNSRDGTIGPPKVATARWRSVSCPATGSRTVSGSASRSGGSTVYSTLPLKELVPDLAVESIVNPPLRLKPTAVAPARSNVTWSTSWLESSADSVPNIGSETSTPSKRYTLSWPLPPAAGPRTLSCVTWTPGASRTRLR